METRTFLAFRGMELLARGPLADVARALREAAGNACSDRLSLYVEETGEPTDIDVSGTWEETWARLESQFPPAHTSEADQGPRTPVDPSTKRGPGRPRLGVVSREISLLPRHWEWLAAQRGGASATLRRLVDQARKKHASRDLVRRRVEAAHRFLWDIAGDLTGFEEASRALFAHDFPRFERSIRQMPVDVQGVALRYVAEARTALAFGPEAESPD